MDTELRLRLLRLPAGPCPLAPRSQNRKALTPAMLPTGVAAPLNTHPCPAVEHFPLASRPGRSEVALRNEAEPEGDRYLVRHTENNTWHRKFGEVNMVSVFKRLA